MKGDKLFKVSIVMALCGLIGIIIGFVISVMSPVIGAWVALICFVALCVSLVLSLIALFVYAFD